MGLRPTCPKCRKPAYRGYAQVQNPETHRSTSVAIGAVFCGEADYKDGHGVLVKTKDHPHGLVMLDGAVFAAQVRQSRALVARIPKASRKGGKPAKETVARRAAEAKGKKPKAAKPAKGKKAPTGKAAARAKAAERLADEQGSE